MLKSMEKNSDIFLMHGLKQKKVKLVNLEISELYDTFYTPFPMSGLSRKCTGVCIMRDARYSSSSKIYASVWVINKELGLTKCLWDRITWRNGVRTGSSVSWSPSPSQSSIKGIRRKQWCGESFNYSFSFHKLCYSALFHTHSA